jgi:general secretion pathway protein G
LPQGLKSLNAKMKKSRGFTLLELMVVIVIIGILLNFLVPIMVKSRYLAQLSACEHNEHNVATALESYRTDNAGAYPNALDSLTVQGHITGLPICPVNKENYSYVRSENGQNYTIYCEAPHYLVNNNVGQGFPQYTPVRGLLRN